jgi:CheY-like chemotaxis protein
VIDQERKETVLVIDHDPDEQAFLVEGVLSPFGYQTDSAADGSTGLQMALSSPPDVLLLDMELGDFSGHDLITAVRAQIPELPIIVLANKGEERAALDAFRLGARDVLTRPVREAELIQIVERILQDVRIRNEREALIREVQHAADTSESHLRELKTLMGIGKSVAALSRPSEVFDRVLRAALQLTRGESTGLYLIKPDSNGLILEDGLNMSRNLIEGIGGPVQDDLASLVLNSQEPYLGSGAGLAQMKPAQQGAISVIYAPLVFQGEAIGVLWVANSRVIFEPYMRDIVSALSDYAAIALHNAQTLEGMEARVQEQALTDYRLEQAVQEPESDLPDSMVYPAESSGSMEEASSALIPEMRRPLTELLGNMNLFRTGEMGPLGAGQQAAVDVMHRQLDALVSYLDSLTPPDSDL